MIKLNQHSFISESYSSKASDMKIIYALYNKLLVLIVIQFGFAKYLDAIDHSFNEQEAQVQAYDLFKKFGIVNIPFIIEKNLACVASNRFEIDMTGLQYAIIADRKSWEMLNEMEREFVLCHEISHIKRKHYIVAMLSCLLRNIAITLVPLVTMHHLDKHNYRAFSDLISKISISVLITAIIKFCSLALEAKIARQSEYQADKDALFMTKNLQAGIEALKKRNLIEPDKVGFLRSLFADHPSTDERIKELNEFSSKLKLRTISKSLLLQ